MNGFNGRVQNDEASDRSLVSEAGVTIDLFLFLGQGLRFSIFRSVNNEMSANSAFSFSGIP
jgi:hypothetical protein